MPDYIRTYWPIISFSLVAFIAFVTQWGVIGIRIYNLESTQDKQAASIMLLQSQQTASATNFAALQSKVDSIGDNVNYIRNRIDSVTK